MLPLQFSHMIRALSTFIAFLCLIPFAHANQHTSMIPPPDTLVIERLEGVKQFKLVSGDKVKVKTFNGRQYKGQVTLTQTGNLQIAGNTVKLEDVKRISTKSRPLSRVLAFVGAAPGTCLTGFGVALIYTGATSGTGFGVLFIFAGLTYSLFGPVLALLGYKILSRKVFHSYKWRFKIKKATL
ncbi:MAG: hypothetical protein AAFO96_27290 [Bacteroidota bacterium]